MIKKEEVKHIAKLARIRLTDPETERFQAELSSILDYFRLLEEIDAEKVEPTFHSTEDCLEGNAVRKDEEAPSGIADELIGSAPVKKGRHIKVKSILK